MKSVKRKSKAFTLIELLVVIAIIALLLSIVIPALGKAKLYAQKILCKNNIRSQSMAVKLYSEQNKGWVPRNEGGNWFQDITFWNTNELEQYSGVDHKSFYCPLNKIKKPDDARFWEYSALMANAGLWGTPAPAPASGPVRLLDETRLSAAEQKGYYRVMSYIYLFDRLDQAGVSRYPKTLLTGEKAIWIRKMSDLSNSSATIMIVDNVQSVSNTSPYNFTEISGGLATWGIFDSSNHLSRRNDGNTNTKLLDDANYAYADGHVDSLDFNKDLSTIKCRVKFGPYYWW